MIDRTLCQNYLFFKNHAGYTVGHCAQVQTLLDSWKEQKLPLDHTDVQAWIYQVLGYFRRCYADNGIRRADKLTIDDRDPMTSIDTHAGVLLIRDFYPQFTPTAEHFCLAKWGK